MRCIAVRVCFVAALIIAETALIGCGRGSGLPQPRPASLLWEKRWGPASEDGLRTFDAGLAALPEGDLLISTFCSLQSTSMPRVLVQRRGIQGVTEWSHQYQIVDPTPVNSTGNADVQPASDGGSFLVLHGCIIKLDGDGQVLWCRAAGADAIAPGAEREWFGCRTIVPDAQGGVIAAAIVSRNFDDNQPGPSQANYQTVLLRLSSTGEPLWCRSYGLPYAEDESLVVQGPDPAICLSGGLLYVGGIIRLAELPVDWSGESKPSNAVLCLDLDGTLLWQQYWFAPDPDSSLYLDCLAADPAGGVCLAALYMPVSGGNNATQVLASLDPLGAPRWQESLTQLDTPYPLGFISSPAGLSIAYPAGESTIPGIPPANGNLGTGTGAGNGTGSGAGTPGLTRGSSYLHGYSIHEDLLIVPVLAGGTGRALRLSGCNDFIITPPVLDSVGNYLLLRSTLSEAAVVSGWDNATARVDPVATNLLPAALQTEEMQLNWLELQVEAQEFAGTEDQAQLQDADQSYLLLQKLSAP